MSKNNMPFLSNICQPETELKHIVGDESGQILILTCCQQVNLPSFYSPPLLTAKVGRKRLGV
uniref:Uncharacterized protein n=1 Tax=Cannabis sativa TaxID=3483 RepID=A0A803R0H2_CANSA